MFCGRGDERGEMREWREEKGERRKEIWGLQKTLRGRKGFRR